ncbi:MAG: hypothetical protein JW901_05595 [Dehalococcoidia bacterium]|nr:hypothetical protein [Dehalococcoidia bacterium]
MSKTVQALDDLGASLVGLIPSWVDMLKSTRFLTLLGTAAGIFLEYKITGGFATSDSLWMAGLTALTGVSFMGFKTLRSSIPAAANDPAPAALRAQETPAPVLQPQIVQVTPFDSKALNDYVESNVLSTYGAATMAAKYYTAMTWLNYHVKFDNGQAYLDAIDYIEVNYALPAFKEIWGKTYDEAVTASVQAIIDNKPCTLKGIDTIAAYLGGGRREILDGLRDLRGLRSKIDYRLKTVQGTGISGK